IKKAEDLVEEYGYYMPQQFQNEANPAVHERTTGQEIARQMGDQLDAFISGVGTGGTITGVGRVLKDKYKGIKLYAVEPKDSAVLSGKEPGPHKIQGIGAGFIPKVLDTSLYDEVITVTNDQAYDTAREAARLEGLLGGVSSGAALYAAQQVAKSLGKGKKVLAI